MVSSQRKEGTLFQLDFTWMQNNISVLKVANSNVYSFDLPWYRVMGISKSQPNRLFIWDNLTLSLFSEWFPE